MNLHDATEVAYKNGLEAGRQQAYSELKEQGIIGNLTPITCHTCKYYEGVHNTQGHAPCKFWDLGGVMWNDFCSRWERHKTAELNRGQDNG